MRVKRGTTTHKRHNKIRKATTGMTRSNRSSIRRGKQAITKALVYATRDRKNPPPKAQTAAQTTYG